MSRLCWIVALGAISALLGALPAAAQEDGKDGKRMIFFGRALSAHVLLGVAPDYIGSDDYRVRPAGSLSLSTPGAEPVFTAPDDGVNLGLIGDNTFSAGPVGRWRSGRDDHGDLKGFDKIDWAIEAGAFAVWWPADWLRLRGEVRRGFGGNTAWAATVGADAVYRKASWTMSIGPRLRWADDKFTRTYFGVTPAEAARSPFGVTAYDADGDFLSMGVLGSLEYQWSPRWSFTSNAEYQRLTGDAADSPIVSELGSKDQFRVTVGVQYAF